jgi:hypothetical protein
MAIAGPIYETAHKGALKTYPKIAVTIRFTANAAP